MHILIIGGTGMLSGVAIQLAREGPKANLMYCNGKCRNVYFR